MMNYKSWKLITESLAGTVTLGLSKPNTLAGPIGSLATEDFGEKDKDFDDDTEESDEDSFGDEEDDTLDGDLMGASKDDGVEKGFPPDDSESMDGLPTPDEEMGGIEDLHGMGTPVSPEDMVGGDLSDVPQGDDMGFLGDIDPELAGQEGGDMEAPEMGAEMGAPEMGDEMGAPEMGDEMGAPEMGGEAGMGEPCPDCNMDGSHEDGDPECPTCHGLGFLEMGDDIDASVEDEVAPDQEKDTMALMSMMQNYMNRYMKKESTQYSEFAGAVAAGAKAMAPMVKQVPAKMKKFMSKDDKAHCRCEGDEFLNSLSRQAKGTVRQKFNSGLKEDALIAPAEQPEPKAGDVGFAPQGKIGSIGNGYTMDDISLPTLGESKKYLSLTEWANRKRSAKKRKK